MELRSFSTPDFKNIQEHESSSPYISLELLGDDGDDNHEDDSDWNSDDSFTDSESVIDNEDGGGGVTPTVPIQDDSSSSTDTSSGLQIFRKPKTLKRPANRRMSNKLKDCLMKTSSIEKVEFYFDLITHLNYDT